MSFLNQLKAQANAAQTGANTPSVDLVERARQTEAAAKTCYLYIHELAKQLTILQPPSAAMYVHRKTPWPEMQLRDFRVDPRKKILRDKEVMDYVAMNWSIVPKVGQAAMQSAHADFLPDLERIEKTLKDASVRYEKSSVRLPAKPTVTVIQFDYLTEAKGSVVVSTDHDNAQLSFRLVNVAGLGAISKVYGVQHINSQLLDELAKLIVGQPSCFI